MILSRKFLPALLGAAAVITSALAPPAPPEFHKDIQPILEEYCFDCHADGMNKGKVALDEFKNDADLPANRELWLRVLKNLRAGLMLLENI